MRKNMLEKVMSKKITFSNAQDISLSARLDTPETPKAYALFAHCFTCNKDLSAVNRISKTLVEHDIALFRFDFTGLGNSCGDFSNSNFSSNIDDLVSAAHYMEQHYKAPRILIGHSLGGAAVLSATHCIPTVEAVVTIGAPATAQHVKHNFTHEIEEIERKGEANVTLAGREFTIKKQFLEDISRHPMVERIKQLNAALLVMHSPTDDTVSLDNARMIYDIAKHPKSFISLDDADHLLMKHPKDAIYVAKIIAAWVDRYIQ